MGYCKKCGKKEYFLFLSEGLCKECYEKKHQWDKLPFMREKQKLWDEQDEKERQYHEIINQAEAQYKIDNNLDALIKAYESVYIGNNLWWNTMTEEYYLARLYQKNGQFNKSWAFLNDMALRHPDCMYGIRLEQSNQLKREKRYYDSLENLVCAYYYLCIPHPSHDQRFFDIEEEKAQNINRFLKDFPKKGKPLFNKLKLSEADISEMESICLQRIKKDKTPNEKALLTDFRNWYDSKR